MVRFNTKFIFVAVIALWLFGMAKSVVIPENKSLSIKKTSADPAIATAVKIPIKVPKLSATMNCRVCLGCDVYGCSLDCLVKCNTRPGSTFYH